MRIRKVHLENWKNFLAVDIELGSRAFFVGPNAAGKSNLLDAFLHGRYRETGRGATARSHPEAVFRKSAVSEPVLRQSSLNSNSSKERGDRPGPIGWNCGRNDQA